MFLKRVDFAYIIGQNEAKVQEEALVDREVSSLFQVRPVCLNTFFLRLL